MERLTLEELKPILKDKWLDYYEANQPMIDKFDYNLFYRYGTKCPKHEFILWTIIALEPRLEEPLSYFLLVCSDLGKIVEALGLNFDPSQELRKRELQKMKTINVLPESQS